MSAPPPIITLTTDFGQTDHYVAQMKGIILRLTPHAAIVDVTHEIPPQDVRRAAFLIADLADAFPRGTIHVAVVDPGVGSERNILAARADGQVYIAPDNGLLSVVLNERHTGEIVAVQNDRYRRSSVTATFHGRDIMAPAAAHLANGLSIDELGPRLDGPPVCLLNAIPRPWDAKIEAHVAWIDHFGNIVTNVRMESLLGRDRQKVRVSLGDHTFSRLRRYYAEVPVGDALLLVGSSERLEVAVNGGSAADRFGVLSGAPLIVEFAEG
jgi:S-adenosylmethionine hydrolase